MPRREPLNQELKRLLKITARMPLASVANLAPVLGLDEERVRRMLGALRRGGWVTSVVRGMTERRQHRWFLTRRAVDLLYVTDHQHPAPREEARAVGLAASHPEGELPEDYRERFALDHDHPVHLENQGDSPFAAGDSANANGGGPDHEHPPWTATSRGIETSLRRLAMLEPVYRLAPDLPLLMVCETARGRRNFRAAAGTLPMLTTTLERAPAGPLTGAVTVWSRDGVPAALHCR